MKLVDCSSIKAFAIIVDINRYSSLVQDCSVRTAAQDARDILVGGISAIEAQGGQVVSFMGDAFLAVLEDPESVVRACEDLAKDVDRQCEYISQHQRHNPDDFTHMPGGPSVKICIEYGEMEISSISSRFLGKQLLLAGSNINYASRIGRAGEGNRCLLGPEAAKLMGDWGPDGPYETIGKHPGERYEYYVLSFAEVWVEGPRIPGEDTYLG